jgi:glutaconate CoA-transferase subunit B
VLVKSQFTPSGSVIMRLRKHAFVREIDFCTNAGHLGGKLGERAALQKPGSGSQLVVTDKAVFSFDDNTGEMVLSTVPPGVTIQEVEAEMSWPLQVDPGVGTTKPPRAEELWLIREELDPGGAYTR